MVVEFRGETVLYLVLSYHMIYHWLHFVFLFYSCKKFRKSEWKTRSHGDLTALLFFLQVCRVSFSLIQFGQLVDLQLLPPTGLTHVINAKLDRILCTSDMAKLETMEEEGLRIGNLRRYLTAAKLELKGQIQNLIHCLISYYLPF